MGDYFRIQNQVGNHPNKWDKTGGVIEVRQYHQYVISVGVFSMIILWNHKFLWKFTPMHHLDGRRFILNEYLSTSDSSNQSPSTPITFIDLPGSPPKLSTSPPSVDQHLPTNPPCSYGISSGPPATTHIVASPPLTSTPQVPYLEAPS